MVGERETCREGRTVSEKAAVGVGEDVREVHLAAAAMLDDQL